MIGSTETQVLGINAWIKPFKFFLSTVILIFSMNWFLGYLDKPLISNAYAWTVVITLGFELIWISYKAHQGEISHFNISSGFNGFMFSMMATAITIMTICTAYIGILFFQNDFPELSTSYLWGIRLGILFFVIFAFEGFLMGARLSHTVGGQDGGLGIKILNWSVTNGDLRIAHFVGMHALQVLPLAGYYLFTSEKSILAFSAIYFGLSLFILIQSLMGIPLFRN